MPTEFSNNLITEENYLKLKNSKYNLSQTQKLFKVTVFGRFSL